MRQDKDLISLDGLIADLGGTDSGTHSMGSCGLLMEHLQAARRDLLGSQQGEYSMSLEQAKDSVAYISDQRVRAETKKILQSLLDPAPPAH